MGYGWNVERVGDANDRELLATAFERFRAEVERPTLIIVDSHIGYGSPHKQDTPEAHGEPLGEDEVRETKRAYGWPEDAQFLVPDGVYEHFAAGIGARGHELSTAWDELFAAYGRAEPELAAQVDAMQRRELPGGLGRRDPRLRRRRLADGDAQGVEQGRERDRRARALDARRLGRPHRLDLGAAELRRRRRLRARQPPAGASCTTASASTRSAATSNGLSLSKLRPLWSTYLTFSDYARPAIRLSALMELPVIHVFTHDSIGLGEDGPTHQPVEQLASLRAIPGLNVIRPCDANEVAEAWRVTMEQRHQPVALVLTRQDVPILDRSRYASADGLRRGGYVLADPPDGEPELILIATGSEVALARRGPRRAELGGSPCAGRQPAVVLPLRPAARGLSRERAPARRSRRGSRSSRRRRSAGTATSGRAGR